MGGFCKFGSFQPYLTHTQLDWSIMMFIESHFYGYPTCLVFAHVVWWLRALWTARTTRRTRPGSLLTWGCITSVEIFFNKDVMCCGDGGWDQSFLYFQHVWPHLVHVSWWSTAMWTATTTRRRRPGRWLTIGCITLVVIRMWYAVMSRWCWLISKFFILSTCLTTLSSCVLMGDDTEDGKDNYM